MNEGSGCVVILLALLLFAVWGVNDRLDDIGNHIAKMEARQ